MHINNTELTALETIDRDLLLRVAGGEGFWSDMQNLGKAAVNGGVNTLNFLHNHPIEVGKFGTFGVGGTSQIQKPFTDNPLSKVGHRTVTGTPHAAPHR